MEKEQIKIGKKSVVLSHTWRSKKELATIESKPLEMCGTVCCMIDIRNSVVAIANLEELEN